MLDFSRFVTERSFLSVYSLVDSPVGDHQHQGPGDHQDQRGLGPWVAEGCARKQVRIAAILMLFFRYRLEFFTTYMETFVDSCPSFAEFNHFFQFCITLFHLFTLSSSKNRASEWKWTKFAVSFSFYRFTLLEQRLVRSKREGLRKSDMCHSSVTIWRTKQ